MTGQVTGSPAIRPPAQIAGAVYLFFFLTAISGALFMRGIVVTADAELTARNILAHEPQFRLGWALGLISTATYVVLTALLYALLKPVNKTIALVAAFVSLVGCAIQSFGSVLQLAPSVILKGMQSQGTFTPDQLKVLALLFVKLDGPVSHVALVFFGSFCFLIGWLIYKSTFLPRILGTLLMLAGIAWLSYPFLPPANVFLPFVEAIGVLAEGLLMLWLLLAGVNVQRWNDRVVGVK